MTSVVGFAHDCLFGILCEKAPQVQICPKTWDKFGSELVHGCSFMLCYKTTQIIFNPAIIFKSCPSVSTMGKFFFLEHADFHLEVQKPLDTDLNMHGYEPKQCHESKMESIHQDCRAVVEINVFLSTFTSRLTNWTPSKK